MSFTALGANADAYCAGDVTASTSETGMSSICCPKEFWNNISYRKFLGDESWQYENEKLVRSILVFLLDNLSNFAYDYSQYSFSPELAKNRIQKALTNWDLTYNISRWYQSGSGESAGGATRYCNEQYENWKKWVSPPVDAKRMTAIDKVAASVKLSSADWIQKTWAAINNHPNSGDWLSTFSDTSRVYVLNFDNVFLNCLVTKNTRYCTLLTLKENTVYPSPWLKSLLDLFASPPPLSSLVSFSIKPTPKQTATPVPQQKFITSAGQTVQQSVGSSSNGLIIASVVGGVALLGIAGYFYFR